MGMMQLLKGIVLVALVGALSTPLAHAATVYYQPTPYPADKTNGVHIWDGWLGNKYNTAFTQDAHLQMGGWGDVYLTYIKFDTKGLPANVSQATVWLMPYSLTNPTNVNFYNVSDAWNTGMTWSTQPGATFLGWRTAPTLNSWWGTTITPWYNPWAANPTTNYGL